MDETAAANKNTRRKEIAMSNEDIAELVHITIERRKSITKHDKPPSSPKPEPRESDPNGSGVTQKVII